MYPVIYDVNYRGRGVASGCLVRGSIDRTLRRATLMESLLPLDCHTFEIDAYRNLASTAGTTLDR